MLQALKSAMSEPAHAVDPTQTHEYQKLFTTASKHAEVRRGARLSRALNLPHASASVGLWADEHAPALEKHHACRLHHVTPWRSRDVHRHPSRAAMQMLSWGGLGVCKCCFDHAA
jgi:hypothetical protein